MKKIIAVSCLMLVSSLALAEAPSYSYLEITYASLQSEEGDVFEAFDIDGVELAASYALTDHVRITTNYRRGTGNLSDDITTGLYGYQERDEIDVTSSMIDFGVGYYGLINESTTWDINVGYSQIDRDITFKYTESYLDADGNRVKDWVEKEEYSSEDNGVILSLGVRSNITDSLELNGGVAIMNLSGSHEEVLSMGALYTFSSGIGITASLRASSDFALFGVGARYTF